VALPRLCVSSVINKPTNAGWMPYTLSNLGTMPVLPGVMYTYLLPAEWERAACFASAPAAAPLAGKEPRIKLGRNALKVVAPA
jgi:hypothetical protein